MKFVIYSQPNCSYCDKAKNLLNENGYDFEEIEVTKSNVFDLIEYLDNEFGIKQFKTVPQIHLVTEYGKEYIGGFDELDGWQSGNAADC